MNSSRGSAAMAFFGATISADAAIARLPCWLVARTSMVIRRPSGAFAITLATIVITSPGCAGSVVSTVWRTSLEPAPGSRPAMSALMSALAQPLCAASALNARVARTIGSTMPAPIVAACVARSEKSSGVSVWTRRASSPTCSESNGRFSIAGMKRLPGSVLSSSSFAPDGVKAPRAFDARSSSIRLVQTRRAGLTRIKPAAAGPSISARRRHRQNR